MPLLTCRLPACVPFTRRMRARVRVCGAWCAAGCRSWWEDVGTLRGGLLVYNTGRALESFTQLQASKAACMAAPEVLISAVGTKVGR